MRDEGYTSSQVIDQFLNNMLPTPEIVGYLAATLTTSSFLPQAILTIKTKDTEGLSLGMYCVFTFGVLFWLIYGLLIGDYAIIFSNAITLLLSASILCVKIYNTFMRPRLSLRRKTGRD